LFFFANALRDFASVATYCDGGHRDGAVHADQHAGFCGEVNFFAFARDDINGAARETEAKSANGVAEDGAD